MPFNTLFSWWIGRRMDRIHDYRDQALANQARTLEFHCSEEHKHNMANPLILLN